MPREAIDRAGLTSALPAAADAYFRAQHIDTSASPVTVDAGFSVVVVLDGAGSITSADGIHPVSRGDVLLIPYAAGAWTADGALTAVACRPPAPDAPEAVR